jgi:hypothetical protein
VLVRYVLTWNSRSSSKFISHWGNLIPCSFQTEIPVYLMGIIFSFLLFFSLGGTGVWPQCFELLRQILYHLSCTLVSFCFTYFLNRVCVYALAGLDSDLIYASHIAGMIGMSCYTKLLLVEMGVSWSFCPGWPQTVILPISAFWVTRITGMSHPT